MIDYEQIENYLEGKLQGEELQQFEHRIETDPSFAETVQLYRNINNELKTGEGKLSLKESLVHLNKQYFHKATPGKLRSMNKKRRGTILIASLVASAAAIFAIFILPLITDQKQTATLFNKLVVIDSLPARMRGQSQDSLKLLIAAAYNNKDYTNALPLLEQYTSIYQRDAAYAFAKGVCYSETGNHDAAIRILDSLLNGNSAFKYKSMAMKARSLFRQGKEKEAVEVLKSIPPNAEEYSKAQELIRLLE